MLAPTPTFAPRILVRKAAAPTTKEAAIREAAQLLTAAGCIEAAYGESMLRRETVANTYLGHGVVIPHGMVDDRHLVRESGLAVLQVPEGILWHDGQMAHLVVAIAAQASDTHITVLRRLTRLIQDEARLAHLRTTTREADIVEALSQDSVTGAAGPATDLRQRFDWTVDYPTGLHARPASRWVEVAKTCPGTDPGPVRRAGGGRQEPDRAVATRSALRRCRDDFGRGTTRPARWRRSAPP